MLSGRHPVKLERLTQVKLQRYKGLYAFTSACSPSANEVGDTGISANIAAGLDLCKQSSYCAPILFGPQRIGYPKLGKASKTLGSILNRHSGLKWVSFRSAATFNQQRPAQGSQTVSLSPGSDADVRALVCGLSVEPAPYRADDCQERGVFVDHATVHRWTIKMLPVLATLGF